MKAAYIEETGPPENIIYGDLPDPRPNGAEVLVKVGADTGEATVLDTEGGWQKVQLGNLVGYRSV